LPKFQARREGLVSRKETAVPAEAGIIDTELPNGADDALAPVRNGQASRLPYGLKELASEEDDGPLSDDIQPLFE
jgi:hypothetical protein